MGKIKIYGQVFLLGFNFCFINVEVRPRFILHQVDKEVVEQSRRILPPLVCYLSDGFPAQDIDSVRFVSSKNNISHGCRNNGHLYIDIWKIWRP